MITAIVFSSALHVCLQLSPQDAQQYVLENYRAAELEPKPYIASEKELEESRRVFDLSVRQQFSAALRLYQKLEAQYSDSPQVANDYLLFLMFRRRYDSALAKSKEYVKKFPNRVIFQIVRDKLIEHSKTRDRNTRSQIMKDLDALLAAANRIQTSKK